MLERQREGIDKAKAEGKYEGRPKSIDAAEIKRLAATMGPAAIAKHLGIARSSVYRLMDLETGAGSGKSIAKLRNAGWQVVLDDAEITQLATEQPQ